MRDDQEDRSLLHVENLHMQDGGQELRAFQIASLCQRSRAETGRNKKAETQH